MPLALSVSCGPASAARVKNGGDENDPYGTATELADACRKIGADRLEAAATTTAGATSPRAS